MPAAVHRLGRDHDPGVNDWAGRYLSLPSLTCPRTIVNDAVAITEDGRQVENSQLQHYAGGARHLVFGTLQLILTDEPTPADRPFLDEVLSDWDVDDTAQLRECILALENRDRNEVKRLYGHLAPRVTAGADSSPLADRALRLLTGRTARGVVLLAPLVESHPVLTSCVGALATDPAFAIRLADDLAAYPGAPARPVPAALDPLH